MSTKLLMTVEQFEHFAQTAEARYELVDGELVPLSSGVYLYNRIRDLAGHLL